MLDATVLRLQYAHFGLELLQRFECLCVATLRVGQLMLAALEERPGRPMLLQKTRVFKPELRQTLRNRDRCL